MQNPELQRQFEKLKEKSNGCSRVSRKESIGCILRCRQEPDYGRPYISCYKLYCYSKSNAKKCNCCIEFALQKLTLLAVERMIGCRIKH